MYTAHDIKMRSASECSDFTYIRRLFITIERHQSYFTSHSQCTTYHSKIVTIDTKLFLQQVTKMTVIIGHNFKHIFFILLFFLSLIIFTPVILHSPSHSKLRFVVSNFYCPSSLDATLTKKSSAFCLCVSFTYCPNTDREITCTRHDSNMLFFPSYVKNRQDPTNT